MRSDQKPGTPEAVGAALAKVLAEIDSHLILQKYKEDRAKQADDLDRALGLNGYSPPLRRRRGYLS